MLGKMEGRRRRGRQRTRWLDGSTDWMDMSWGSSRSWWWMGKPGLLQSMGWQRIRHNWETELNWADPLSTHVRWHYLNLFWVFGKEPQLLGSGRVGGAGAMPGLSCSMQDLLVWAAMQEAWVQSLGGKIAWRRAWQPTPVFLPGESHGQRSLVGYGPWGCKELDMTKWPTHTKYMV